MANPTPSTGPAPLTGDLLIDALTTGYRWALTGDRTIDWSISGGQHGEVWNSPSTVIQYAGAMLSTFSFYANVKFNGLGSFADPLTAVSAGSEINFYTSGSFSDFPSRAILAYGLFPTTNSDIGRYPGAAGDIVLNINSAANSYTTYDPGSAGWFTFIHEIGHTLGLKHPFDSGGTGRPTVAQLGLPGLDIDWATIMAYGDDYNYTNSLYDPATPMVLDVLALQYLYGPNLASNAGDSTFTLAADNLYLTLWDPSGIDAVSAAGSDRGWSIFLPDVSLSTLNPVKVGYAVPFGELNLASPRTLRWLMGDIEDAIGSAFADEIYGSALPNYLLAGAGADYVDGDDGNDTIEGGAGNDSLFGGRGNDQILGGDGDDFISGEEGDDLYDGGNGTDTVGYTGNLNRYTLARSGAVWAITDTAANSPFGFDGMAGVERLQFSDRTLNLTLSSAVAETASANILRQTGPGVNSMLVANGALTLQQATEVYISLARASSSVATLSYEFFTGKIPSAAGMDYLVSPTGPNPNNLNSAYFQSFSLENRYINFAVNLGKAGEGAASFLTRYGGLSLFEATRQAYATIFGGTPSDAKLHAILDPVFQLGNLTLSRTDYFALYGGDGPNGIGTKAAMVGYLLAEAVKADIGVYAKVNDAFLADVADGAAFAVDLVGVYGKPEYIFNPG